MGMKNDDADNKILIVVDMQNDFITGVLGTKEAQDIVNPVVDYIKNFDGMVFATLDAHKEDTYNLYIESKLCPKHCIKSTNGYNLEKHIKLTIGERTNHFFYEKNTYGSIQLASDLRNHYTFFNLIEIVGLCTDICVISNALLLRAYFPNRRIIVHADMCAGTTPEKHKEALDVMRSCGIEIVGDRE